MTANNHNNNSAYLNDLPLACNEQTKLAQPYQLYPAVIEIKRRTCE